MQPSNVSLTPPHTHSHTCSVHNGNDGTPSAPGPNYQPPMASHTLQMAPLLPQGVHWLDESFYQSQGVENGVFYPGGCGAAGRVVEGAQGVFPGLHG